MCAAGVICLEVPKITACMVPPGQPRRRRLVVFRSRRRSFLRCCCLTGLNEPRPLVGACRPPSSRSRRRALPLLLFFSLCASRHARRPGEEACLAAHLDASRPPSFFMLLPSFVRSELTGNLSLVRFFFSSPWWAETAVSREGCF